MAKIKLNNLKIIKGAEKLKLYKFGKNKAEHFFALRVEYIRIINHTLILKTMNSTLHA